MFQKQDKIAEIIHTNYSLLPVLNRFGIKPGLGDYTVEETCELHKIDTGFFLEILNIFHDENYFPTLKMQKFNLRLILDYLKKTHRYYITYELPEIEKRVNFLAVNNAESGKSKVIINFFEQYKKEVLNHLDEEEGIFFPYVEALLKLTSGEKMTDRDSALLESLTIKNFEETHEDIDTKLMDLKNIIIKYFPGNPEENLCNELIFHLVRFEKDLKDHARIEDKILVKKVLSLEKSIEKSS